MFHFSGNMVRLIRMKKNRLWDTVLKAGFPPFFVCVPIFNKNCVPLLVLFKINYVYNKTLKFIYGMLALRTGC